LTDLARHQFTVQDEDGNAVPGAHVEVRLEVPGQPLASLFSDRTGLSAIGNPFDTDADGFAFFHVTGGAYQIRVYTGASGAPTFEAPLQRWVAIGLNSEADGIGTPDAGDLQNCTNLPLSGLQAQAPYTLVGNFSGLTAAPTASALDALTAKALPDGADLLMIQDQADSGSFKKVLLSTVGRIAATPEMFGAIGDGSDETEKLQDFLDAAPSYHVGIFTPGKTYWVDGLLFVRSNSYLIGYGATVKALVTATINSCSVNFTDDTQGTAAGPVNSSMFGLTVHGNGAARFTAGSFAAGVGVNAGMGAAASFYMVAATNCHLYDCKSIEGEADGFYMGGHDSIGLSSGCTFNSCFATLSRRNAYSFVGTLNCSANYSVATETSYGATVGNLSTGFDQEPDGTSSKNNGLTLNCCKAFNCVDGFAEHGAVTNNVGCAWISPFAFSCTNGFLSGNVGPQTRITSPTHKFCTNPFVNCNSHVGYTDGDGGTVTQASSKTTGVTLNRPSGAITMNAATLNAGNVASFVLTNDRIAATDVLVLNHISGGAIGAYMFNAQCGAGSATINVRNISASNLSEAIIIQYALIKGAQT